ncbi:MAG TPA: CpsD/CapB family tyrosine-protein kinase [Thermodesulfobacteriota bacterium]|nr:CpsD/CapB family tyrosine-protein kinase [Thermodesulfobacteriota bacterium]
MSRIYRALEKAEEEKRQKAEQAPPVKVFEERAAPKKERPTIKFPEEKKERIGKTEELRLPPKEEELPVLLFPRNSIAEEEFRKLKTQIFLRLPNPPHSILITSTGPGEGKTTVSVNLAMAISKEIHRKAILVDADLRKPSIHLENSRNAKGLSDYLSDGIPLTEVLINSQTEKLQVIMAGPSTERSSELIASKRMGEFLKSLRESAENTYILIDSSPIIATTEPTVLSKMVDGIILVVMADRMPRESIQRAVRSIDRQKIIGIVFNRIDLKSSSYYSRHYYYKYYKK